MESKLASLVARLESVVAKLEGPTDSVDLNEFIEKPLKDFINCCSLINLADWANSINKCFEELRIVIKNAAIHKSPPSSSSPAFKSLTRGLINHVEDLLKTTASRSVPAELSDHAKVIASFCCVFNWINIEIVNPTDHISITLEECEFYLNRILKAFKNSNHKHIDWVNSLKSLSSALKEYVSSNHPKGLKFNPKGPELENDAPKVSASSTANLFNEINNVTTAGLRKVEKSEMTHKNPLLRASSIVSDTTKKIDEKPAGEPKLKLEGKRWEIHNQFNQSDLHINPSSLDQMVALMDCKRTNLFIESKCNQISLYNCHETNVQLESLVAGIELVKCTKVKIYVKGIILSFTADMCDGLNLFLQKCSTDVIITTIKCSSCNVTIISDDPDKDPLELPIAERIQTKISKDKSALEFIALDNK